MSISKAKKARKHMERQGKPAPDRQRGSWQGVRAVTKRTPTLQEKQARLDKKHRRNRAYESDGSFCVLIAYCRPLHQKGADYDRYADNNGAEKLSDGQIAHFDLLAYLELRSQKVENQVDQA